MGAEEPIQAAVIVTTQKAGEPKHSQVQKGFLAWEVEVVISSDSGFPGGPEVKASACSVGDLGSIPGSGISPGEGNSNPLQCSCLENPMDVGAWWATVHGVAKSRTRLSDLTDCCTESDTTEVT